MFSFYSWSFSPIRNGAQLSFIVGKHKTIVTFTVITPDSNGPMESIHNRKPLALHRENYYRWLTPGDPLHLSVVSVSWSKGTMLGRLLCGLGCILAHLPLIREPFSELADWGGWQVDQQLGEIKTCHMPTCGDQAVLAECIRVRYGSTMNRLRAQRRPFVQCKSGGLLSACLGPSE